MRMIISIGVAALGVYLSTRGLTWAELQVIFSAVDGRYLMGAFFVTLCVYWLRALRWYFLFPVQARQGGLRYLFPALAVGNLADNFHVRGAGDMVRLRIGGRYNHIPRSQILSTIVTERIADGFLLTIVALVCLQNLSLHALWWTKAIEVALFAVLLIGVTVRLFPETVNDVLAALCARFPGHVSARLATRIQTAVGRKFSEVGIRNFIRLATATCVIWLVELCGYAAVAMSLGLWLQPLQLLMVLAAVNFALLVPATPGGLGIVELFGTEILVLSGLSRHSAFALVVTHHLLQYSFSLLVGLFYCRRQGFSLRDLPASLGSRNLLDVDELVGAHIGAYPDAVRRYQETAPGTGMDISIVIPAFNEEARLLPTLLSVTEYFNRTGLSHEIIVVDDGSADDTSSLVRELGKRFSTIKLIRLPQNMGKGAAVRTGVRNASGNYILFNDADGATPIQETGRLLAAIERGADVAIGSRALYSPETRVQRNLGRAIAGRIFAFFVNAWVIPGIADTQCGFKMFRHDAAHRIFAFQRLNGFAFDVEVLRIASLLGYRILEVPINWTNMEGSKVRLFSDALKMTVDVIRVRYLVPSALQTLNDQGKVHIPSPLYDGPRKL